LWFLNSIFKSLVHLVLISVPQWGIFSTLTKPQKESVLILFSFLEEFDNDVNFLSSSQASFFPLLFPQQSIFSATNCGLNIRMPYFLTSARGMKRKQMRIIILLISCQLVWSCHGIFVAERFWSLGELGVGRCLHGSVNSQTPVKRKSLGYVNMRCHTSHCLCITGAESAEEMPYVSRLQCSGKVWKHTFFQSLFKLDVATRDILFSKHISVERYSLWAWQINWWDLLRLILYFFWRSYTM